MMRVQATGIFRDLHLNRCSQVRDFAMSNGATEDAQNGFVGSAGTKNAIHQMRLPQQLQAFFALPAVLASEVGYTGKTINQIRLVPDSLIYPVLRTLPKGFLLGDVLLSRCHGQLCARRKCWCSTAAWQHTWHGIA